MLQLNNLKIFYGRRLVINGLSTASALQPGQVIALVGSNGSGKSTLLKSMAGLVQIASGSIVFNGSDLERTSFRERARQVAYVPQNLLGAVHLSVFESVLAAASATLANTTVSPEHLEKVQAVLDRLGISHLSMRYLDSLSGGQKQLVGLAQALVRQPRLLLLDEPLSALDLNYQFHVMDLIRRETRQHGLITIIVLHDLSTALRHADHCLVLHDGTLIGDGIPSAVIDSALLATVYGVRARIEPCSQGFSQVVVDGLLTVAALM